MFKEKVNVEIFNRSDTLRGIQKLLDKWLDHGTESVVSMISANLMIHLLTTIEILRTYFPESGIDLEKLDLIEKRLREQFKW